MNADCKICGTEDLFSAVTGEGVCSVCTMKFFGGGVPRGGAIDQIKLMRDKLNLADGEYLQQDHGKEAARILGRKL